MSYITNTEKVPHIPSYGVSNAEPVVQTIKPHTLKSLYLFAILFFVVLIPSLLFTFLRPAIYQSEANLLVKPHSSLLAQDISFEPNLEIEKSLLLSQSLLMRVVEQLRNTGVNIQDLSVEEIQKLLNVSSSDNLLTLRVEGEDKSYLNVVLTQWIDTYLAQKSSHQQQSNESADKDLTENIQKLEREVALKRDELDAFREANNIESIKREENIIVARLKKVHESINQAKDDLVSNQAKLKSFKASIKQGKPVFLPSDERAMNRLEQRAMELRENIKDLERQFTPEYISITPRLQAVYQKLEDVKRDLAEKHDLAIDLALNDLNDKISDSKDIIKNLEQERLKLKSQSTVFEKNFSKYTALQEELLQLEGLLKQTKTHQIQNSAIGDANSLQVDVLTPASVPLAPVRPLYLRDSLISIGASLAVALLGLTIYFLVFRPKQTVIMPNQQIFYSGHGQLGRSQESIDARRVIEQNPTQALGYSQFRELTDLEIQSLLEIADDKSKLLVYLLMSGVSADNLAGLRWQDIDVTTGLINQSESFVNGWSRENPITTLLQQLESEIDFSSDESIWADKQGNPLSAAELDSVISYLAHDAGISNPQEINSAVLLYTYLAYLSRQGLRFTLLSDICQQIPEFSLDMFQQFSPPGKKKDYSEIQLNYPFR